MADRVGQKLGNYRLARLLGRGGFAEVYLGEHIRLGTQAAIKVLHTQLADDDVEGFLKEARTIASLEHPHIVRVLDFDVQEYTPFLVMGYAPNGTLRQRHARGTQLPLTTVVVYVKDIADALQYAHDEKLIHRDIKPDNILLGRRDEILLSDFGIATMAQSSRYQSTQDMVGTMAYMAPEQIQGKPRPASDQYALGIVVYEWLTGDRPFQGGLTEMVGQHLSTSPPPLREKVATIPPDIEQVVLTALEKDPHRRFASVQAFAKALEQASMTGQAAAPYAPTILVKPPTPVTLPPTVAAPSPPAKSISTPALPPTQPVVISKSVGTVVCTYRGHSAKVNAVAWSPDGKSIASGGNDKTVQVWDATTSHRSIMNNSDVIRTLTWSPDGKQVASGGDDQIVQVWSVITKSQLVTYRGHSGWWSWVLAAAWFPDGKRIVSGDANGKVHIWNADTGKNVSIYRAHSAQVYTVACSPDNAYIASGSGDGTVQVWNATTGKHVFTHRGHSHPVNSVVWSPDGRYRLLPQ